MAKTFKMKHFLNPQTIMQADVATKMIPLIQMRSVSYRRSWREVAHAGHRVPDRRGSQRSGVLSGSA